MMDTRKIGLNCGSGQRPFKSTRLVEWRNWDIQGEVPLGEERKPNTPDLICDLRKPWPADDGTVDYVALHHVMEHEGCNEAAHYRSEAFRVLKPGGSLFVFVPDLRALAQAWLMGKMDTQLYMTNVYGAFNGDEHDRHRWGFDRRALLAWGRELPWAEVKDFDWRIVPGMDAARDWWILDMECVK